MHSFCMVARVINISPLCPGWGPPYRKWIVCHTSSPRTDQAVPYIHNIVLIILISHVCRESVAPVDAPMDYHIHYTVIRVWKWRKVLVPDCVDWWSIENGTKIFEMKTLNLYPYWIFNNDKSKYFFLIFRRLILIEV